MKILIFLAVPVLVVLAKPFEEKTYVDVKQDTEGNYESSFNTGVFSKKEEGFADGSVKGTYSYLGPDGKEHRVDYTADANNGFVAESDDLPKPVTDTPDVVKVREEHLAAVKEAMERLPQTEEYQPSPKVYQVKPELLRAFGVVPEFKILPKVKVVPEVEIVPEVAQPATSIIPVSNGYIKTTPGLLRASPKYIEASQGYLKVKPGYIKIEPKYVKVNPEYVEVSPEFFKLKPNVVSVKPSYLEAFKGVPEVVYDKPSFRRGGWISEEPAPVVKYIFPPIFYW